MLLKSIYSNRNADAKTLNFLDWLDATFTINNIVQLCYQGSVAGSEFITYAATKLYVALEFDARYNNAPNANLSAVTFYDQLNAAFFYASNLSTYWDATAAAVRYYPFENIINNIYFSRISVSQIVSMRFNGFRITIP